MKIVLVTVLLPGLSACSGSDFSSAKSSGDEDSGSVSTTSQPADEENELANEPVMVSGNYLTLGCAELSKGDKNDQVKSYSSAYGCALLDGTKSQYAGEVSDVSCAIADTPDLKVFRDSGPWHFLLAVNTDQKDPLKNMSCRLSTNGMIRTFATVEKLATDFFEIRKVFELKFDEEPCNKVEINTLLPTAPDAVNPDCAVIGRTGNALRFNGASTFLSMPVNDRLADLLQGDYSVTFWFRTPGPDAAKNSGFMTLIGQKEDTQSDDIALNLRYCPSGTCKGVLAAISGEAEDLDTQKTEVPMSADAWYHIAVTKDDKRLTIYLNGLSLVSDHLEKKDVRLTSDLLIGRSGVHGEYLAGALDEFAIWSGALDERRVNDLMKAPSPPPPR